MSGSGSNHLDAKHRVYEQRSLEVGEEFRRYADWIVAPMLPHIRGRVLEIGAGLGTIAERYLDRASSAVLLEPARNLHGSLAARMAGRSHVSTACGFLDEVAGQEAGGVSFALMSFDVVVMVNVLEHIEDDVGTLALVRSLLRPGGRLIIFVPAVPALHGTYDEKVGHVRRYTKRQLGGIVATRGFNVERLRYVDMLGMAPWFLSGRLLRQQIYDRFVVPMCRAVDRVSGPPIGKNLLCIASALAT
jgi:SAM-dependent methyltransferase